MVFYLKSPILFEYYLMVASPEPHITLLFVDIDYRNGWSWHACQFWPRIKFPFPNPAPTSMEEGILWPDNLLAWQNYWCGEVVEKQHTLLFIVCLRFYRSIVKRPCLILISFSGPCKTIQLPLNISIYTIWPKMPKVHPTFCDKLSFSSFCTYALPCDSFTDLSIGYD